MSPIISVIICTHNPRADYLQRTLTSLKNQTIESTQWELIIVDNLSKLPVSSMADISWCKSAKVILEPNLGLTNARICGIKNSKADILLFVDDDNVLADNYIEKALNIAHTFPQIGAFGGSTIAEYDQAPEDWFHTYATLIGVRKISQDMWSNFVADFNSDPIGAGMIVRKVVANEYIRTLQIDLAKKNFDRKGDMLTGSGDIDIAHTACKIGYGKGVFSSLSLTHLISSDRIKESYILKLAEGTAYSSLLLSSFNGKLPLKQGFYSKIKFFKYLFSLSGIHKKIAKAYRQGEKKAISDMNCRILTNTSLQNEN